MTTNINILALFGLKKCNSPCSKFAKKNFFNQITIPNILVTPSLRVEAGKRKDTGQIGRGDQFVNGISLFFFLRKILLNSYNVGKIASKNKDCQNFHARRFP